MLMAAVLLSSVVAFAQHAVGAFSIQPKVGITIANMTNSEANAKVGLIAGAEAEYQATSLLGISFGALYSMQGTTSDEEKIKTEYVNVPILLNFYVAKGFALKAGIQPGFRTKGELEGNIAGNKISVDAGQLFKDVDFSIPVGLSYEVSSFVLDARYNWGLTKVFDTSKLDVDTKNSVFQITLGYKFDL